MSDTINKAIGVLKKGGTIIYPTDTVWGIGCDATSSVAVNGVIQLKQNRGNKGFIVLMDSVKMVEGYFPILSEQIKPFLLDQRPTTVIIQNPVGLPRKVCGPDGSLAVRIPKDPICLELISGLAKPLLSTSANFSGEPVPGQYSEINSDLLNDVDYVINLPQRHILGSSPSRLVLVMENGGFKILRN